MKHLFESWPEIQVKLRQAEKILLLSDYDGTLTPIVSTPQEALLAGEMREQLQTLSAGDNLKIGIISGRQLSDLKELVALEGIYYAGNHGLEIEGPGCFFIHPDCLRTRNCLIQIAKTLEERLAAIDGVIIEDKGLSLSLHYRLVKNDFVTQVKGIFYQVCRSYKIRKQIKVTYGKKVLEVRPPVGWDKGKAVHFLTQKALTGGQNHLTLYLGDDQTDEDAFEALMENGISIRVGENQTSHAVYFLNSPAEVKEFLARLQPE